MLWYLPPGVTRAGAEEASAGCAHSLGGTEGRGAGWGGKSTSGLWLCVTFRLRNHVKASATQKIKLTGFQNEFKRMMEQVKRRPGLPFLEVGARLSPV